MFIRVVLPAPFSPSSAWISPGRTSRSIASLATTPGYRFVIPRISSAGARTISVTPALMVDLQSLRSRYDERAGHGWPPRS